MAKKEVLVSVIVPVYNLERVVAKCLFSLLFQKYQNLEIVVVDDGSDDDSLLICKKIAKSDSRIKVFHQKNLGLSAARNFGLKKSHGELIAFVDGDDNVDPGFVSRMVNSMNKNHSDIVVCGYSEFYGEKFKSFNLRTRTLSGKEAVIQLLTRQENSDVVTWNKLYKKELFSEVEFPVGKNHEDNLTTYKLYGKAKKVSFISESLYNYVRRNDSLTNTEDILDRLNAKLEATAEQKKFFKKQRTFSQYIKFAELLAWLQFIDYAIIKKIPREYFKIYHSKIIHEKDFKYLDSKRRFYIFLLKFCGGVFYKLFRKFIH